MPSDTLTPSSPSVFSLEIPVTLNNAKVMQETSKKLSKMCWMFSQCSHHMRLYDTPDDDKHTQSRTLTVFVNADGGMPDHALLAIPFQLDRLNPLAPW